MNYYRIRRYFREIARLKRSGFAGFSSPCCRISAVVMLGIVCAAVSGGGAMAGRLDGLWVLEPDRHPSAHYFRIASHRARGGMAWDKWHEEFGGLMGIEGRQPVEISGLTAHAAPDVMFRRFAGGLVLANPSGHEVTLDMTRIWPGERFGRIKGSANQDRRTNNGRPVGDTVVLGSLDGLFLVRETSD